MTTSLAQKIQQLKNDPRTIELELDKIIAPAFYNIHWKVKDSAYDQFWIKGGRGSTKSSFAAIQIILGVMGDPDANALVLRKVGDTVRHSVLETLLWAIEILNAGDEWEHTTAPAVLTYKRTGQKILCKGLDDPKKLKSIKLRKGYFKYLWFEELEEFSGMKEVRNIEQSVLRGGTRFIEFLTYNPPIDPQSWVNIEADIKNVNGQPPTGRYIHESTYLDVPREWLGDKFIQDAESLRESNPLAYDHEYMGIATGIHDAIIFGGKYSVREFDVNPAWEGPYYGADWGFSQDPNTLVKLWVEFLPIDPIRPLIQSMNLYVEHALFSDVGVDLDDLPEFWDKVLDRKDRKVYADSARPETIAHMNKRSYKVEAAEKWPGSVEDGIAVLRTFKQIIIHTRNKDMAKEARLYSYKIDRLTKDVSTDIVDKFNHGWDAIRYALAKYIKPRRKGLFS